MSERLEDIAAKMVAPGQGILAADESNGTCTKRFKALGIPSTGGLRLRQAYADAAGQGVVVWNLGPRGDLAANEIKELYHGLLGQNAPTDEQSVANR